MNWQKTGVILVAMWLWLLLPSAHGRAGVYHFVTLEYPPLEYQDTGGRPEGVAVEMVSQIMTDLGHRLYIEVLPWTRALKMVRYGKADAIFTIFRNAAREGFLDYSEEVLIPQLVALYALSDNPVDFDGDLEALEPYKIGVVSTISYGQTFDRLSLQLTVERTATLDQNLTKLLLGRIDLVISNVYQAESVIDRRMLNASIKRLRPHVERIPSYVAFSKIRKLMTLRQDFDRQLMRMKKSGRYAAIVAGSGLNREGQKIGD
jgi:polar amino acid transport system substrate-binding protein